MTDLIDMASSIDHINFTIEKSPKAYRMYREQLKKLAKEIQDAETKELIRIAHG